jgi:predicted RNA-binding Zn-ribbon protein involved in translation (DUF1610 family)
MMPLKLPKTTVERYVCVGADIELSCVRCDIGLIFEDFAPDGFVIYVCPTCGLRTAIKLKLITRRLEE